MLIPSEWRKAGQNAVGCWLGCFCLVIVAVLAFTLVALIAGA